MTLSQLIEEIPDVIDSINYAIFYMGASEDEDDEFNKHETRKHLFVLRELVRFLNKNNENEN